MWQSHRHPSSPYDKRLTRSLRGIAAIVALVRVQNVSQQHKPRGVLDMKQAARIMTWIKLLRWTAQAAASYNRGLFTIVKLARARPCCAALFKHNDAPQPAAQAPLQRGCVFPATS